MKKFLVVGIAFFVSIFYPNSFYASPLKLTVDGIGGIPTADLTFPVSFKNLEETFSEISVRHNLNSALEINVTADLIDEPSGILIDVPVDISIIGKPNGKTHLRFSDNGIPENKSGGPTAIVIIQKSNQFVTLKNFIITPQPGPPGVINTAVMFISNEAANTTNSNITVENCIFTAIKANNQIQPNVPVLTPFSHSVNVETSDGRRSELRSFDGGKQANIIEIHTIAEPAPDSFVTVNFRDCIFTHILTTLGQSKGGAISVRRKTNWTLNVSGCIFSYLEGSAIRCNTSENENTNGNINLIGTEGKPNIFYKNGWMENLNDGMASGVFFQSAEAKFQHCYFIKNYSSGIVKNNGTGNISISECVFAENQFDLNPAGGTPPSVSDGSNLKLYFSQSLNSDLTIRNSTFYDCNGQTGRSIYLSSPARKIDCVFDNVIFAGTNDKIQINSLKAESTYTESNCAFAQSGTDSLMNPGFLELPGGITATSQYRSLAAPIFDSGLFNPVWNSTPHTITGLANYLRATTNEYDSTREAGASPITGHSAPLSNSGIENFNLY